MKELTEQVNEDQRVASAIQPQKVDECKTQPQIPVKGTFKVQLICLSYAEPQAASTKLPLTSQCQPISMGSLEQSGVAQRQGLRKNCIENLMDEDEKDRAKSPHHRCPPARANFAAFSSSTLATLAAPAAPAMAAAPREIRHNYHADCEAAVNVQIQLQLYASYVYLSMAVYCDRFDVALKHISHFFLRMSHQWGEFAEKLMVMQTERGGRVAFRDISQPDNSDWRGSAQIIECALHLEDTLHKSLLELHRLAASKSDLYLCDFVLRHYLQPQVEVLKELGKYLTVLHKLGPQLECLADYLFGSLTLDDGNKEN
ncbi:Ferritin heavy chain [Fukomys damarensis]|uniref:Ferritin n=1 Tax=Fukomys damarensis TaxID=885580 RepID=A0A091D6U1_FUKDA|nr:Ferritin heavy chain [Fukomys damarensis]